MLFVELYKIDIFNVKNINHFRWFNPKPLPGVSHNFWEKGNAKWPKVEFLPSQWNVSLKCKVCFRKIEVVFLAWWVIIELRPPSTLCRDSSALLSIYVAAVFGCWLPAWEWESVSHDHRHENWHPRMGGLLAVVTRSEYFHFREQIQGCVLLFVTVAWYSISRRMSQFIWQLLRGE